MKEYVIILEDILLVVSNLSLLPAIYLAVKGQFRGEAILFTITMFASSMYHLCDNKRLTYCTLPYSILQYLDFYSAIMTLWCAAIVLANVPLQWISAFHLVGALFYGTLLFNSVAGVWSFVIPAFCTLLLVGSYWGHLYYTERRFPDVAYTQTFFVAVAMILFGSFLFASQTFLPNLYGITHSLWHICMGISITLLLPRYQEFFKWNKHPFPSVTKQAPPLEKLEAVKLDLPSKFPRDTNHAYVNAVFSSPSQNTDNPQMDPKSTT